MNADIEAGMDRLWVSKDDQDWELVDMHGTGPEPLMLYLDGTEKKFTARSVCVRLESDEAVEMRGIRFQLSISHPEGTWEKWSECKTVTPELHMQRRWSGKCGVGARHRKYSCPATLECMDETETEYCTKRLCETMPLDFEFAEAEHGRGGAFDGW